MAVSIPVSRLVSSGRYGKCWHSVIIIHQKIDHHNIRNRFRRGFSLHFNTPNPSLVKKSSNFVNMIFIIESFSDESVTKTLIRLPPHSHYRNY